MQKYFVAIEGKKQGVNQGNQHFDYSLNSDQEKRLPMYKKVVFKISLNKPSHILQFR